MFQHEGTPPMTWSSELAQDAEIWAQELAAKDKFEHDTLDDVSFISSLPNTLLLTDQSLC